MSPEDSDSFAPFAAVTGSMPLGGASVFLVHLASALAGMGMRLPVAVIAEENRYRAELAEAGAEVFEASKRRSIYEDRLAMVRRWVGKFRPRAVLSCLSPASFEILRLVPPGTLRIGMIQSDDPTVYETLRLFAPWVDVMVGVSRAIRERLEMNAGFGRLPAEEIPYGISFRLPAPGRSRQSAEPLRVVYVGRLVEEQKRVSRIVEVIRTLHADPSAPPMQFTLAGSGPDEPALREALGGCENVRFTGEISNQKVQNLLVEQDAFLLLSDFEGLPLALLEAMGMGVVPVVSDLESGIREVVDDGSGIRVPVGDVRAASAALRALAGDRRRLADLAARGIQKVRGQFSAETMARRYLDLVERLGPSAPPAWPNRFRIPVPLCVEPAWRYRDPMRTIRRLAKSLPGRRR